MCVMVKEKASVRRNDCLTSDPATEIQEKRTFRAPWLEITRRDTQNPNKTDPPSPQTPRGSHWRTDWPAQEGRRGAGQSAGNLMLQEHAVALSLPNLRCCYFTLLALFTSDPKCSNNMKVKLTVMLLTLVTRDKANGMTGETKGGSWTPTENTHQNRTYSLLFTTHCKGSNRREDMVFLLNSARTWPSFFWLYWVYKQSTNYYSGYRAFSVYQVLLRSLYIH